MEVGKLLVPMRSGDFSCEQCGVGSAARVTGRDNYERAEPAHAQATGCKDSPPIDIALIPDNYSALLLNASSLKLGLIF